MREDFAAHVVHRLLAHALHDANLCVLRKEIGDQHEQKDQADPLDTAPRLGLWNEMFQRRSKVAVNGLPEKPGRRELQRSDHRDERHAPELPATCTAQILQQPPHQPRVVRFAELLLLREYCSCAFEFFFQQLFLIQIGVIAAARQKFIVRSAFGDAAIAQNDNLIGIAHR